MPSSWRILRVSHNRYWLSIPLLKTISKLLPIWFILSWGEDEEEESMFMALLFFPCNRFFFSLAEFTFFSRSFMYLIATSIWSGNANETSCIKNREPINIVYIKSETNYYVECGNIEKLKSWTFESCCGTRDLSWSQRFFIWFLLFFSMIRRSILAAVEDEAENWKLGSIRWRRMNGKNVFLCLFDLRKCCCSEGGRFIYTFVEKWG